MDLYDELMGVVDVLAEAKLDYAVCGGLAVAFHGYTRFTRDIDLMIQSEDVSQALEAIKPTGFRFSEGNIPFAVATEFEGTIHRVSKFEGKDHLTLDFLLVNPSIQDVWDGRETFEWTSGKRIQVVSRRGLQKLKRIAGRRQDVLDLEELGLNDDE